MSSWPACGPQSYDLYAVLVHRGHSLHSGHYVCYVKAGNGMWHLCDDHRVAQVGLGGSVGAWVGVPVWGLEHIVPCSRRRACEQMAAGCV